MLTQRRGKNVAVAGVALQCVIAVVLLVLWFWTGSLTSMATAWLVAGGVGLWLVTALLFYSRQLERREALELEQIAARYRSRSRFITDLTLDPPTSTSDLAQPPFLDEDYLILSTIHSAQGCVWDVVHIIHAADGMIPSDMAVTDEAGVEEERRLLFVGITRAERFLALSFARSRTVNGSARENRRSPFLADLEGLEAVRPGSAAWEPQREIKASRYYPSGKRPAPPSPDPVRTILPPHSKTEKEDSHPFGKGKRVHHPTLGLGRVEKLFTLQKKERVIVQFEGGPRLNMDIELSKLKPSTD